jgi:hypothetical protein
MRKKRLSYLLTLVFVAYCGEASTPCGVFTFTGTPHTDAGIDNTVSFAFDPAQCGAPACATNTIAYVQIVRIVDITTGNFLSPNSDQTNRIVTGNASASMNGWAVDRISNRVWGYYGRNNDGSFSGTLTPGSNAVAAVLRDRPSGWPDNSWFDAVSVPVCIDAASTCVNQLLGYYYWLFVVSSTGTVGTPFDEIGRTWHRDAVDLAVVEWNNDAAGLGKNAFPAFTRMP